MKHPYSHLRGIIGAGLLFVSPLFAAEQQNVIGPFSGVNNADNPATIPAGNAQDALNVDLSLGGKSVLKRKGYSLAYALSVTTSAVHGVYEFYDASGNDISLYFNDTRMTSSINGGPITVLFSSGPFGATYQCTDSQGFAYCANTSRNNIIKTNGATYTTITPVSTGTMVTVTPDRLVLSGFLDAPNRVDFSAAADFTSWVTGVSPTSAFNFTITAPGSKITHIRQAFNRTFWFKDNSFGYILQGQTAADWVVQIISPDVGTLDNTSVFDKGVLYFRAQDSHIYSYDGTNLVKLTRDIGSTINLSQRRTSNFWRQTTQSDFAAGASTPTLWVSTTVVPNAIALDSAAAISPFIDHVSTNFAAGTLINLSTATPNTLRLSFVPDNLFSSFYPGTDDGVCPNVCLGSYYSSRRFLATQTAILSSIVLRLKKTGSPADFSADIMTNSGGLPGSLLESGAVLASNVPTSITPITINYSSTTILTAGNTYWIKLSPNSGTCDSSNKIEWYGTGGFGGTPGSIACGTGLTSDAFPSLSYKVFTTTYNTSGSIVSRSFDTGFTTNTWRWVWTGLSSHGRVPIGSAISYETQTSSSSVGGYDSLVSVSSGSSPTSTVKEFIKYKASFTTTDPSTSPVLTDVSISMDSRIRPGATYYSAVKNAANISAWDIFQVNKLDIGGTNYFSIRASTNPIQVLSSTPSWTPISAGAIPNISTGSYFQIADMLTITDTVTLATNLGVVLYDFTQNWIEGQALDKAYGTYFKDAIWWSVASGTSATTNNKILRYDLVNQAWLLYDLPSNGFYVKGTDLYFGGSSSGNIFKFGGVDNDNGSAINAYWKSKDFFNESPFSDSDIPDVSLFFASVANSSMTVVYSINGSSSTSYTVPTYRPVSYGIHNRAMPQGTSGNTFNIQFGNNAADQPFEVFAIQYGTVEKPWKPGSQ